MEFPLEFYMGLTRSLIQDIYAEAHRTPARNPTLVRRRLIHPDTHAQTLNSPVSADRGRDQEGDRDESAYANNQRGAASFLAGHSVTISPDTQYYFRNPMEEPKINRRLTCRYRAGRRNKRWNSIAAGARLPLRGTDSVPTLSMTASRQRCTALT